MIEKLSFDTVLFWLIGGASIENQVKNLKIRTEALQSTDRSILGVGRSVYSRNTPFWSETLKMYTALGFCARY